MRILEHSQTKVTRPITGGLSLPMLQVSPYFSVGRGANKSTLMVNKNAILTGYQLDAGQYVGVVCQFLDPTTGLVTDSEVLDLVLTTTDPVTVDAAGVAAINTYAASVGYNLLTFNRQFPVNVPAIPMYVSGVAKTNSFAVVGAPTVAGGAGVARFYIDSNGDGTGTAPAAVFASSLQAVVVNSTTGYIPTSVSVDTNRKYIDVTMKSLTFSTGLAGILTVLTGQTLTAASNGTTVNCFVLVQK